MDIGHVGQKRKIISKIALQVTGKLTLIDCSEQLGDCYVCPHGEGVACLNLLHQRKFKQETPLP